MKRPVIGIIATTHLAENRFPAQRVGVRFAIGDLAARKLPEPREMNAVLPPCDEESILPLDDGGDDDDARHCVGS